jgi:Peptidase family M28
VSAIDTVSQLAAYTRRGAGTDAERRAARRLADELAGMRRQVAVETFWCRPNWALAHSWHVVLVLAGSLVSVGSPRVGIALLTVALVSTIADAFTGVSLGRRLTPERASQNVVASREPADASTMTRLIVTANYDSGRMGLVYRDGLRAAAARLRAAAGPLALGWQGWLCVAIIWLLVVAALRAGGAGGTGISLAQLPPSVGIVVALALLLELSRSTYGPGAGDNASGTAVAISLVRALDAAPPRHLAVELLLQGGGDAHAIGLRHYLRARRHELRPESAIVLGVAASGAGTPHWWISDGPLVPLRYSSELSRLCADTAGRETHLNAEPHRGRGGAPAFPARQGRFPSTTIGCLDRRGLVPRSHQPSDTPEALDPEALDAVTQFGLIVVDALDAYLAGRRTVPSPTPA